MQPNDQRGYWQPEPVQPPQSVAPPLAPTGDYQSAQPAQQQPPTAQPSASPAPIEQDVTMPPLLDETEASLDSASSSPQQGDDQLNKPSDIESPVSWQAQEYIHQEKGTIWFIVFGVVLAVMIGVALWQQAWTFVLLLVVIATTIVVFAKRPPRLISYSITRDGLSIDETLHPFKDFKSFGVVQDGEEYSIMLIPTKRLQPGVTVYFPEAAGEAIVDMLGARLPMRELQLDAVDRFVRKIRL